MKKKMVKVLSAVMAGVLLLTLGACGKSGKGGNGQGANGQGGNDQSAIMENDGFMWTVKENAIPMPKNTYISGDIKLDGDILRFIYHEYDEKNDKSSSYVGEQNISGGSIKTVLSLEGCVNESDYIQSWYEDENGFIFLISSYDEKKDESSYIIRKTDGSGNVLNEIDVSKAIRGDSDYVGCFVRDKAGNILVSDDSKIYILDQEGNLKNKVSVDGFTSSMVELEDGRIVASGYFGRKGNVSQIIDVNTGKLAEELKDAPESYNPWIHKKDNVYYVINDSFLYEYNLDTQTSERILEWADADMRCPNTCIINDNGDEGLRIIHVNYSETGEESIAIDILKKEVDDGSRKTLIMASYYGDYAIEEFVRSYNRSQTDVRVKMVNYSDTYEWEAIADAMKNDILAGKVDIVDSRELSSLAVNDTNYIALDDYIEKDPEINLDDYYESVMKAMRTNGHIYSLSPNFDIQTMLVNGKYVQSDKITMDDLIAIKEKVGKNFMGPVTAEMVLPVFLNAYPQFLDMENGTCDFDNEEFVKLLKFASEFKSGEFDFDMDYDEFKEIQEEKLVVVPMSLARFEEIQVYEKLMNGNVKFTGYPTDKGSGHLIGFNSGYSIPKTSKNQEEAWSFLKNLMLESYQNGNYHMDGFPIRKASFDIVAKSMQEQGGGGGISTGSTMIEYGPIRDSDIELVKGIIDKVELPGEYNDDIINIITEEAGSVFKGGKDPKEVAGIIQNRVSLYLAEHN